MDKIVEGFDYKNQEGVPKEHLLDQILSLWANVFPQAEAALTKSEVNHKPRILFTLAFHEINLVGFKVGYEINKEQFFSWLGGVQEEYRGQGVGNHLMKIQHQWCRAQGYKFIRTFTQNKTKPMLILNLKNGFDVLGTYTENDGHPKILLQKKL